MNEQGQSAKPGAKRGLRPSLGEACVNMEWGWGWKITLSLVLSTSGIACQASR